MLIFKYWIFSRWTKIWKFFSKSLGTNSQQSFFGHTTNKKNETLNINLSNHDLDPTEDFEEALKNEIIIYDE